MSSKEKNVKVVSIMSEKEQRRLILIAKQRCYKLSVNRRKENSTDGASCQVTWDGMLCWDRTQANSVTSQACPNYVNGFNTHGAAGDSNFSPAIFIAMLMFVSVFNELATKLCTENGTWWVNPDSGVKNEWTNFIDCVKPAIDLSFHAKHGDQLRLLYTIGYSFSLGALLVAVIIMLLCKRLHSKSNTLHINLFLAFILRAVISFIKDILFVGNVGLAKDVKEGNNGILQFVQDDPHWECKLLFTIFTYCVNACNMWIFAEALYLSMLVYKPLATERRGVRPYVILGWTLPLVFIIPWVVVKALHENTFHTYAYLQNKTMKYLIPNDLGNTEWLCLFYINRCWNIQHSPQYYWIIKGSGIAVVVVNFLMFLNIFRKLFLKLRHTSQLGACSKSKYRKLAKFILVLIPLFGVMYIAFYVALPSNLIDSDFNLAYMYLEMGYNSFQGFFLALLFCFLNGEIHAELKRVWYRYKIRRKDQAHINNPLFLECIHRKKSYNSYNRCRYSSNMKTIHFSESQNAKKSLNQVESVLLGSNSHNVDGFCSETPSSYFNRPATSMSPLRSSEITILSSDI